jgi:hypothetical protein
MKVGGTDTVGWSQGEEEERNKETRQTSTAKSEDEGTPKHNERRYL